MAPTLSPNQRWVENSVESIDSIESTRLVDLVVESSYRKSIYRWNESIRPRLIAIRLDCADSIPKPEVGWKFRRVDRFDQIDTTRRPCCRIVIPELDWSLKWVDSSEVINDSTRFAPSASPKPEVNTCETTITWTFLVLKTWRWSKPIRSRLIAIRLDGADSIPKPEVGWKFRRVDRFDRINTTRRPCCRIIIPEVDLSLKWVDSSEVNCDSTDCADSIPKPEVGWKFRRVDRFDQIDTTRRPCCRIVIPELDWSLKWVDSSEVINDSTRFAPSASPKLEVNSCETTITWTFLVLKTWRWSKSIRPRLLTIPLDCAESIPKPEVG